MKKIIYILFMMSLFCLNIFAAQEWDQDPDSRTYRAYAGITVEDDNNNPLSGISVNLSLSMEFAEDGIVGPNNPTIWRNTGVNGTTNSSGYVFLECFITVPLNYVNGYKRVSTHISDEDIRILNNPVTETTTSFYLYPEYVGLKDSELAARFAPIIHYHNENPLFPMPIEAVYGYSNSTIENNPNGVNDFLPLPVSNHTPNDWKNYFNNTLLTKFNTGQFDKTVYYKIFEKEFNQYNENPVNYYIIQYWCYYPFNSNSNLHEGDWEHVAVMLDINYDPVGIILHRHNRLASYPWSSIY